MFPVHAQTKVLAVCNTCGCHLEPQALLSVTIARVINRLVTLGSVQQALLGKQYLTKVAEQTVNERSTCIPH